jgi:predicted nucleic acid-binding protein
VLAWLLGETAGATVREALDRAPAVLASELTVAECARTLVRAAAAGRIPGAQAAQRRAYLARAATTWALLAMDADILARVAAPFPVEPLRTLDAIQLATALEARTALPDLAILSLDRRVRDCAERLGFRVLPS